MDNIVAILDEIKIQGRLGHDKRQPRVNFYMTY